MTAERALEDARDLVIGYLGECGGITPTEENLAIAFSGLLDAARRERDEALKNCVPISDDGSSVFIDGAGDVPLDYGGRLAARVEALTKERDEAYKLLTKMSNHADEVDVQYQSLEGRVEALTAALRRIGTLPIMSEGNVAGGVVAAFEIGAIIRQAILEALSSVPEPTQGEGPTFPPPDCLDRNTCSFNQACQYASCTWR